MTTDDRIEFFERILDTFLAQSRQKAYLVFAVAEDRDEYVQFALHADGILGEVGSRQWVEPDRPLSAAAIEGLASLGFTGGGAEKNYARRGLPRSAADLAKLTDTLFRTAYGVDDGFSAVVNEMNLNDITLPRAEPLTAAMVEDHFRGKQVTFLRDQDDNYRLDFDCAGSEHPVVVWVCGEGEGNMVVHVMGFGAHRPVPADRSAALERCNEWNREHRWPKAVVEDGDAWQIVVHSDIDLTTGINRPLF